MAKIAVFLPKENMLEDAYQAMEEEQSAFEFIKVIETKDAVLEARKAVEAGVHIVVARGVQASLIKEQTNIPVVEIVLTAQEIGLLVIEAKKLITKKKPTIALIGFQNMICNLSYFDQLFDIQMRCYFVSRFDQMQDAVKTACEDGADMILGGDIVGELASSFQIPYLFFRSTKDSLRNAFMIAKKMAYTSDIEKMSNAQFETVLDTAYQGMIKINNEKRITAVNKLIEQVLSQEASEVKNKEICDVVEEIEEDGLNAILLGEREIYSSTLKIRGTPFMYTMAPIQFDTHISGAILTFSKLKLEQKEDLKKMQETFLQGYVAKNEFSMLTSKNRKMKDTIAMAKKYAVSNHPVLLIGENNVHKEQFAQCIHNNSARKNGPFAAFNCNGMKEEEQLSMLYGEKNAMDICNNGTLYLSEIDHLSLICQYQLLRIIKSRSVMSAELGQNKMYDVRIIVSSQKDLSILVQNGLFREDLYYAVSGLVLKLTPLNQRPDDIEMLIQKYLRNFMTRCSCYLTITKEAMDYMKVYSWEGNEIQLENFCERLFLSTTKKNIDEGLVKNLLDDLYPKVKIVEGNERLVVYKHPEAENIANLLKQCNGNRQEAALMLGISTTTLWRRMKKYGILSDFLVEK